MRTVAVFGEILLRLSPPGKERLFQSSRLEARFGGAEANVAVSLTLFGHQVRYISVVPANEIGDAALAELRRFGVGTGHVVRQGTRLGLYFAETGADQRPSRVFYDREHSGIADATPGLIGWARSLEGVGWFHVSGITPATGPGAADLTIEAVSLAKTMGITVSVDLNYRAKLWKYGRTAPEVMRDIVKKADIVFANEEDCQKALGIEAGGWTSGSAPDPVAIDDLTRRVMDAFPNLSKIAVSLRDSRSADANGWSGVLRNRDGFLRGPRHEIRDIVDRIGTGDAFAAGFIHGLDLFGEDGKALEFAVAASCLKHSIPGDFNLIVEKEVLALMAGDRSGRVQR
jgi:2-dehydro-3-deoxygluconokinase